MVFLQILLTTLKKHKVLLICTILISSLMLLMYAASMETVKTQSKAVEEILKSMPPQIMKAFNVTSFDSSTYEGLLASKHFGLILPIMLVVVISSISGAMIAGEIDKGTILLYLNQPLSRRRIYWFKYFSGLIALYIFTLFGILPAIPFGLMFAQQIDYAYFFNLTWLTALFGTALYSIGFAASAVFSDSGKVTFVNIGVFFASYMINILAGLITELDGIKYFSLMYYYDFNAGINGKSLDSLSIPVFLVLIIVFALVGMYCFEKRDVSIR